jgi:hypothetical protein
VITEETYPDGTPHDATNTTRLRTQQLYDVTQRAGWFLVAVCLGSGAVWTVGAAAGWWS